MGPKGQSESDHWIRDREEAGAKYAKKKGNFETGCDARPEV